MDYFQFLILVIIIVVVFSIAVLVMVQFLDFNLTANKKKLEQLKSDATVKYVESLLTLLEKQVVRRETAYHTLQHGIEFSDEGADSAIRQPAQTQMLRDLIHTTEQDIASTRQAIIDALTNKSKDEPNN